MASLTKEQLLKDGKTHDPASITSISLSHKALSDVCCLAEFKNLERLVLAFNNLSSLQGLKSCVNLKWLSVVQNKLETLEGIEGLTKLTVMNAGKNKLRSMEDVKSVVNLRGGDLVARLDHAAAEDLVTGGGNLFQSSEAAG